MQNCSLARIATVFLVEYNKKVVFILMKRFNFTAKCDFVSHLLVSEPVESGVVGAGDAVGGGIHTNGAAGKAAGYLGAQKAQGNTWIFRCIFGPALTLFSFPPAPGRGTG